MGLTSYWNDLTTAAGWRFIVYLIIIYSCTKGGGATLVELGMLPLFQRVMKVSSLSYQSYKTLILLPFSLKPVIAIMVDKFNCKKACVIATLLFSVVCGSALALYATPTLKPMIAALLGFGIILGIASSDLISESQYACLMRNFPSMGSSFVTLVWGVIFLSRLLMAAVSSTMMINNHTYRTIFGAASALFVVALIPSILGWIKLKTVDDDSVRPSLKLQYLSYMITMAAVSVCSFSLGDGSVTFKICFLSLIVVLVLIGANEALPPMVMACNTYMFLNAVFYVDVSTLDYFYTSPCVKGGPNFSYSYFLSTATVVSSIFGAAASLIFQGCFQKRTFKECFMFGTLAKCSGAIIDIILINRWNVGYVDDKVVFMLGNCGLRSLIAMLDALPMVILISRLTPRGNETTMYALLAGFQNLGGAMSIAVGASLAKLMQVEISEETCEYKNLGKLVAIAQMGMPLLALPFLCRIPNKTIKEAF